MAQMSPKKAEEMKDLEMQVRKARHLVRQPELKVEAIQPSIYEIEKFYPKIKIIRRRDTPRPRVEDLFGVIAENSLVRVL